MQQTDDISPIRQEGFMHEAPTTYSGGFKMSGNSVQEKNQDLP